MSTHVHRAHWAADGVPGTGILRERCKCGATRKLDYRGMVGELGEPKASAWKLPVVERVKCAARYAKVALWSVVIGMLAGCGATAIPPGLLADARTAVAKVAEPVREAAPRVNRIGDTLTELCRPADASTAPVLSPDLCAQLEGDFNAVSEAFGVVQSALPVVDAALATVQAIEAAR